MERFYNGKEILYDGSGESTPTPSETHENVESLSQPTIIPDDIKKIVPSSKEDVDRLCKEIFPVLAIIGGIDRGLKGKDLHDMVNLKV
jgi:hypothetical protein